MALTWRNGRPYLYKSVRKDGRVTSEYRGSGPTAVLIDRLDQCDRQERDDRRQRAKQHQEADAVRQRALDELVADVRALAHAALASAGFHHHNPGEWRQRRMVNDIEPSTKPPSPTRAVAPARFGRFMDDWATHGAIHAASKGCPVNPDRLAAEIRNYADELAGPNPSPIERSLADTAALCWTDLRLRQVVNACSFGLATGRSHDPQRKLDHCHKRYLSVLKTLATVRKLAAPTVRINLARQQVNVADSSSWFAVQ